MKGIYILSSALAVVAGIGATVIVTQYLSVKSELAAVKQTVVTQPTAAQPTVAQPITQASTPTQLVVAPVKNFENLSPCDQMDAIAKSGKSVAQFVASSGRYSEFAAHTKANCNWNVEQIQQADAILNPPVVTVQKIVRQQTVVVEDPISVQPKPPIKPPTPYPSHPPVSSPWNNCNGVQEPGESYSVRCHEDQAWNDRHPGTPPLPGNRDNRVTDDFGDKGAANGYFKYGNSESTEAEPTQAEPTEAEQPAASSSPADAAATSES